MTTSRHLLFSLCAVCAVASCSGGGSSGPPPTNILAKATGDGQSDTVLATLANQLSVLVHDQNNAPVSGVSVNWTAPTGGTVNGAASAVTATTGSGTASVTVTLGPTAGGQTITATSSGLSGSPATFSATANPGNAFALTLNGQSANSGFPGVVLTYSVKVSDSHGNGKPGIPILWAASFGGGTVVPDSNDTNAGGVATTQHHLGAAFGEDSVTATAKTALQGSPVKFQATIAQAPAADTVTVGPGLTFNPTSVTIRNGGTVTFNFAGGSHGVHWTGGPATPADIPTTSSGSTTVPLNTSGTYTYNCTVHGNSMTGSINVQ